MQDEAASYVIQTIAYGLASNVQRIFDFQAYDDGNGEAFGLLRNDNSARPSFAAYQVAAQYLPNYAMVQKATDGDVEKIIFPRATDNNGDSCQDYIIGGSPYLLVEDVPSTAYTANFPLITK